MVYKVTKDGVVLSIRLLPRSSRCEIAGIQDENLKIKITAPPVEGRANEECIRFLSEWLGVRKSRISIVAGHKSKNKKIAVSDLTEAEIASFLAGI